MMWKTRKNFMPLLLAGAGLALAQPPVIQPSGVVNAASGAASVKGEALLVGGAIFSILGENLASVELTAPGPPLPTSLGGTSVTVDGIEAPLFHVSPGKIDFQVPHAVAARVGERLPVVVTTEEGTSEPVLAFVQDDAAAIFTQDGGACGQGLIQQAGDDGRPTWNGPRNSASPGSFITIYGTGLGPPYSPPADGQSAWFQPPSLLDPPGVRAGIDGFLLSPGLEVWEAGLVPGLIGVNVTFVRLSDDVFQGCSVPLRIKGKWGVSEPVMLSIRDGGGHCEDPPRASVASVNWRKVITCSQAFPTGSMEAWFSASFSSAPENLVVSPEQPDLPFRGCRCNGFTAQTSPRCKNAGLNALEAGELTLVGVPGGPVTVLPSDSSNGATVYSMPLLPESLEGGTLRVIGAGGADVGGFETDVTMPPPIQVTTPLEPGTVIDFHRPFSVNWSGGDPDTLVQVKLIAHLDEGTIIGRQCTCPVLAGEGEAKIDMYDPYGEGPILQIGRTSEDAEVVLTVTPLASKATRFGAPGLTREGRHDWSYEYHFQGLKIR